MAEFEFVQYECSNQVGTLTLNRPERHNAFNEQVIQELEQAFKLLGEDETVRAIVLRSEGQSFCAGADLNWMKKMVDYDFRENVEDAKELAHMLQTIRTCPKPTIARVHGAAFGGGVGLIAACDMAVTLDRCLFGLTEVKLGILPAVISPFVLEKIGNANASRYFLTAERFDAKEAQRINLVNEVKLHTTEMDEWIEQEIKLILKNGPEAVSACKKLIYEVSGPLWNTAEKVTTEMIAERRISKEGQEGIKAFLEKRRPYWVTKSKESTPNV